MKKEMKLTAILASWITTVKHNEDGTKSPVKIEGTNDILKTIKRSLKNKGRLVVVANDPTAWEENDYKAEVYFHALRLSGIKFKEIFVVDDRNAKNASEILSKADLIYLRGGKILCQAKFLKKIGFEKVLKNYEGLVIGVSAGAMNLCDYVCNFPEETGDLGQKQIVKGLGYFDELLVPHCDGTRYQMQVEEGFDVFKGYILPFSHKHDLLVIPNDSYIVLDKNGAKTYGDCYLLRKGEVYKKI